MEFFNDTQELMLYYGGCRPLTLNDEGGTLHGWWGTMSMAVTSSDRRLKDNIQPVFETLRSRHPLIAAQAGDGGSVVGAFLDRIRPVSYNLRPDSPAGDHVRFGFIADEMFDVLPEITRVAKTKERTMGILYEDLISVLTARMQDMFSEMALATARMQSVESRIQQRKQWRSRRRREAGQAPEARAATPPRPPPSGRP